MKLASLTALHVLLLLVPTRVQATLSLQAVHVGTIPSMDHIFGSVMLGDKLLFSVRDSGSQKLYRYDGQTISAVDNPLGVVNPSIGVPFGGRSGRGTILNGEYYFSADGSLGRSVYKTDGNTIQFVADPDPSTTTSPIGGFLSTDSHVYFGATGPNGTELFRTDGTNTFGLGISAGERQRFGDEIIFRAINPATGSVAAFRADENGVALLTTTITQFSTRLPEVGSSLYWLFDDQLHRYDGTAVSTVAEASNITSLQLAFDVVSDRFVTFSGLGPNGWAIYTWDGTSLAEFDTDPAGEGIRPFPAQIFDGGFYYSTFAPNGHELSRISGKDITQFDIAPGEPSSSPDTDNSVLLDGSIIFRANGPAGNELYIADESGFRLLADINPNGDAFPFTVETPVEYQGRFYFHAFSPATGREIFSTDGEGVEILADIVPGPVGSAGNGHIRGVEAGLIFFTVDLLSTQSGEEVYVSDATTTLPLDGVVGNETGGLQDHAAIVEYMGDILYFGRSGQVFRISVIPEPAGIALLISAILLLPHRRQRIVCHHGFSLFG